MLTKHYGPISLEGDTFTLHKLSVKFLNPYQLIPFLGEYRPSHKFLNEKLVPIFNV